MFTHSRRRFLQYLAASPLMADEDKSVITDPKDAINLLDFEPAARKALPPAHYGYLSTGVEDDWTLQANRDGFRKVQLRPRRLRDATHVDTSIDLFGVNWESPVFLCPIGNQKAFHAEGELPAARAAHDRNALLMLSTATNTSVEDIAKVLARPPWYQLYTTQRWEVTERLVKRVEAAGCPVMAVTIDTVAGRRTETLDRFRRIDTRKCANCHSVEAGGFFRRKPMFDGIETSGLSTANPALTWAHISRIKRLSSMKLLVKGIETREDALLCIESGADGIVVSNHGGRAGETGRGTIECLPEVIDATGGRVPVLIDGGFRRGADVFKALAMGASAVGIGRPYLWGLAAFGQPGVERVIDMIRAELSLVMRQCGTHSIAEITKAFIVQR